MGYPGYLPPDGRHGELYRYPELEDVPWPGEGTVPVTFPQMRGCILGEQQKWTPALASILLLLYFRGNSPVCRILECTGQLVDAELPVAQASRLGDLAIADVCNHLNSSSPISLHPWRPSVMMRPALMSMLSLILR